MRRLKESRRGTIGLLEGMWLSAAKNCPRGDIGRFSNEEIAIMVDWDGDPDELVDALVECRWLDVCSDHRLVIHDWADHCPTYVKGGLAKKHQDIAIACTSEVEPKVPPKVPPEPQSGTTLAYTSEVSSTKPSLAKPNQAKPILYSCSESQATSKLEQPLSDFEFSVVGQTEPWKPTQDFVERLQSTYETIDVPYQLRAASLWLDANRAKRKTVGGMNRFLVSWMNTATNNPRTPKKRPPLKPGEIDF